MMKILIVEDDLSFSPISEELDIWGYSAEWVTSGDEALERMKVKLFDVIMLDIYLPDCLGYQLIQHFKRIKPNVHIITMTGHNSRELEKEVRKQGITYYMIKPFEFEHLKTLLDHIQLRERSTQLKDRRWYN